MTRKRPAKHLVKAYEDFEEELREEKREEQETIITLTGRKSDYFPKMRCEGESFLIKFNFSELPKYLKESYAKVSTASEKRDPFDLDAIEEINRLNIKFLEKCDAYLKSYFEKSFVCTEYYTLEFS